MNLQQMLKEMNSHGLTDSQIGELVGADQSSISRLRSGERKTTNFERGQKIIEAYKKFIRSKKLRNKRSSKTKSSVKHRVNPSKPEL